MTAPKPQHALLDEALAGAQRVQAETDLRNATAAICLTCHQIDDLLTSMEDASVAMAALSPWWGWAVAGVVVAVRRPAPADRPGGAPGARPASMTHRAGHAALVAAFGRLLEPMVSPSI